MTHRPLSKKSWLTHYSELVRSWRRQSDTDDGALDALQDAVVRMLESGAGKVGNPAAYLKRSVFNCMVDRYRHDSMFPRVPLDAMGGQEPMTHATPEAEVQSMQLLAELQQALEELPLACRQVYILHRVEGHAHAEISRRLGISTDMVEKHMTRAVRHLNRRLQNHV